MNKAYIIKFDYSVLAVSLSRADAEEMLCDLAFENGHYYFNLYRGAGFSESIALEEANRNMDYFSIDEYDLI